MEKSVLKSKTFYVGLIMAIAPLFPQVSEWMSANPALVGSIWGGLTILLRFISKDKIVLSEK